MDSSSHAPGDAPIEPVTRCGRVALLGAPNSGKSTLFNALLDENLSIVTAKAQTTQRPILGLRSWERDQLILVDAPGVLDPRDLMQRALLAGAREGARECDVVLLVLDPTRRLSGRERSALLEIAAATGASRIGVINKIDEATTSDREAEDRWLQEEARATVFPVSARTGEGVPALLETIRMRLPEGPFLYPTDEIATDSVRFFAAERIRESIFEQFQDEIPYATFCEIDEFREGEDPVYIQATVFVEKDSQKGILIGEKGRAIRELGSSARGKIEHFLGARVYLDLWIKVLPNWRRKRGHLRRLGLSVPEDDSGSDDS